MPNQTDVTTPIVGESTVCELPRLVMASLARTRPESFDRELNAVVERIARTTAAEEGLLYDLAKEASEPRLLGHWATSEAIESSFELNGRAASVVAMYPP